MGNTKHFQGVPPNVQPLTRKSLPDDVYHILRAMIVQGRLQPGEKIIESRVAESLGVSRTPVREALHRLEYDGLLITRPGYSSWITGITITDIEEIYPLIAAMEGLAARLATPRLTSADLQYMEELTEALARYGRRGDVEKLMAADAQFHALLHERSQNRRLQRIVRELRGQMERFEYLFFSSPEAVRASVARHKKLVRVLKHGNAQLAERTLIRQWELGRRALVALVREKQVVLPPSAELARLEQALEKETSSGQA